MKPTECPVCEAEYLLRSPVRAKADELTERVGAKAAAAYVNGRLAAFHEQHAGKQRAAPVPVAPQAPVGTKPPAVTEPARAPSLVGRRLCSVEGCSLPVKARGWCRNHYMRWLRAGPSAAPAVPEVDPGLVARWRDWLASMGETGPGGVRLRGGTAFPD